MQRGVLCCVVLCCAVLYYVVPKALLPEGNGRHVYPRVQVNGRAVCPSARCVLVCCCTAGTCAQSHLAGIVPPMPVHGHTGSSGPTAPCVLCCTISTLCAVPHCLVLCSALPCVCLAALHLWAVGSGQWNFCNACHTTWEQWAAQLLQCTASLLVGSGQWSFCFAPPHRLGAVGSAAPATHCLTAWGQWVVELLSCTATHPGGSGQCNSCNALPHCLEAVGSGTPAMRRPISWRYREACPGGGRCLNSGTPATHCHTAWGQWAVQLLQCIASLPGGSGG